MNLFMIVLMGFELCKVKGGVYFFVCVCLIIEWIKSIVKVKF